MKKAEDGSPGGDMKKKRPAGGLKKEEGGGGGGGGGACNSSPAQKRKREAKPEVEKRPFTTRKSSGPFRDRLHRAATQRMFLIRHEDLSTEGNLHRRFHVAGSTGNAYHVDICRIPSCDCPDFIRNASPGKPGVVCKHLILVYLKVLRLSMDDPVLPQKGLLQSELARIFARLPGGGGEEEERALKGVLANAAAQAAYAAQTGGGVGGGGGGEEEEEEVEGKKGEVDLAGEEECPVCLEEFNTRKPKEVVICYTCHKPTHILCFRTWNGVKIAEGQLRSCVWCRAAWVDPAVAKGGGGGGRGGGGGGKGLVEGIAVKDAGYLNVAGLTGQRKARDESSYNEWGKRKRMEYACDRWEDD